MRQLLKSLSILGITLLCFFSIEISSAADDAPPFPEISSIPTATESPTPMPIPSPTPDDGEDVCALEPEESPTASSSESFTEFELFFTEFTMADEEETYKYEGPTTDYTGVPLVWEKVYKNGKCIKQKKFYYCAPCSDMNDEHPSVWIDPATAKFIFEPPYLLGGQKTLGDINFLTLGMGEVGRYVYDLNPDETNANFPLQLPAVQKQTVVQGTSHYGLTPIRTYTIP